MISFAQMKEKPRDPRGWGGVMSPSETWAVYSSSDEGISVVRMVQHRAGFLRGHSV